MEERERWDLHEVPTHFETEDRWIAGHTTFEGLLAAGAGIALYILYLRVLSGLGTFSVREVSIPVGALVAVALWIVFVCIFVERWGGERVIDKVWRRLWFASRPKKTVWAPQATNRDRTLVAQANEEDEEDEE